MFADVELEMPDTLVAVIEQLGRKGSDRNSLLAGGTNVLVDMRARRYKPERLIALHRVNELRGLQADASTITIGAGTTVTELLTSQMIAETAPSLVESSRRFAGQMVRNAATVAGNIACGSPAADLVPPLMSLDAQITLQGPTGTRTLPMDGFFTGFKRDQRQPSEVITRISWRRPPPHTVNYFYKLGRRVGDAITITGVALTLTVSKGRCDRALIALGAAAPTVFRAKKAESMLVGQVLSEPLIKAAAEQAAAECSPIDDVRASAEYRRHTVAALTRRLVSQGWEKLS